MEYHYAINLQSQMDPCPFWNEGDIDDCMFCTGEVIYTITERLAEPYYTLRCYSGHSNWALLGRFTSIEVCKKVAATYHNEVK